MFNSGREAALRGGPLPLDPAGEAEWGTQGSRAFDAIQANEQKKKKTEPRAKLHFPRKAVKKNGYSPVCTSLG